MAAYKTNKERLAFDVFVYTMSRFDTFATVPTPECTENIYDNPDFLMVLSRAYIPYQLKKRDVWKPIFETKFKSNGLKKFKHISELLKEVIKEMIDIQERSHFDRAIASLALINELIQFLYSKKSRLFFNDLARFWKDYFALSEIEFEKEGGFSNLYSLYDSLSFQVYDKIIDYYIAKYFLPYGEKETTSAFTKMYSDLLINNLLTKTVETLESDTSLLASNFRTMLLIGQTSSSSEGEKTEASSSVKNYCLGIPPHEEVLRDSFSSVQNGTSAEITVKSSIEEVSATVDADVKLPQKNSRRERREQVKGRRQPSTQVTSPEEQSNYQVGLTGSVISAEGRSMDRVGHTGIPLTTQGQLVDHRVLVGSPLSVREQRHGRGSQRPPEGISRIEQKRLKLRQRKKTEPTN